MLQKQVQTLFIQDIGNVILQRSSRAQTLRIRISAKEGIIVVLPSHLSENIAIRFINEKKKWIQKSLQRQVKIQKQQTIFNESTLFKTRMHKLYLLKHDKNTIKSLVSGDKIIVWYPDYAQVEDSRIQRIIRKAILEAWRVEARKYLPARTAELARQHNYRYNKITIKNNKTRWGSCSASNNINLNLQLMRLPDRLIDYIILHELTHTIYKNHQKTFWKRMESVFPGARKLDKELNTYHLEYW